MEVHHSCTSLIVFMLCLGVGGSRRADQGGWASDYQWHKDGVWVDQTDGNTAPGLQTGNKDSAAHVALWGNRNTNINTILALRYLLIFFLLLFVYTYQSFVFCFVRNWSCWVPEWWRTAEFLICWLSCLRLCSPVCRLLKNRKTSRHQSEFGTNLQINKVCVLWIYMI